MYDLIKAISEIIRTIAAGISIYIFLRKVRKSPKKQKNGSVKPSL